MRLLSLKEHNDALLQQLTMLARTLSLLAGVALVLTVLVVRGIPLLLVAKGAVLLVLLIAGIVLIVTAFSSDD